MAHAIPTLDTDIFNAESVRHARAVDDRVRELAPVVRVGREDIVVIGRFSHVSSALSDWRSFSSRSRPWHDPTSVRPEILLTEDPPRHTEVRVVIANALSPKALNRMGQAFANDPVAYAAQVNRTNRLTPADVQRAAAKYLTPGRVVMSMIPAGKLDLVSKPELKFENVSAVVPKAFDL